MVDLYCQQGGGYHHTCCHNHTLPPLLQHDQCPGLTYSVYKPHPHWHMNHTKDLSSPQCEHRTLCNDSSQEFWASGTRYSDCPETQLHPMSHHAVTELPVTAWKTPIVTGCRESPLSPQACPIHWESRDIFRASWMHVGVPPDSLSPGACTRLRG